MTTTKAVPDASAIITLNNGARPLIWQAQPGGEGYRPVVGVVLASLEHNDLHPYVVWSMASDDGKSWDCSGGAYCTNFDMALEAFVNRRMHHL